MIAEPLPKEIIQKACEFVLCGKFKNSRAVNCNKLNINILQILTSLRYGHESDDMVRKYFNGLNSSINYNVDKTENNQEVGYF